VFRAVSDKFALSNGRCSDTLQNIQNSFGQCIGNPAGYSGPPHLLSPWGSAGRGGGSGLLKDTVPGRPPFSPEPERLESNPARRPDENRYVAMPETGQAFKRAGTRGKPNRMSGLYTWIGSRRIAA